MFYDYSNKSIIESTNLQNLLPTEYSLIPNIMEIYELELALWETKVVPGDLLIKRAAYLKEVNGEPTYHYQLCGKGPLIKTNSSPRRTSFFRTMNFKTGYASHGLFPYRGKFHPQLIRALLNIIGIQEGESVLDLMTGSGTLNIEAALMNINSVGLDLNPFCVEMCNAKEAALRIDLNDLERVAQNFNEVYQYFKNTDTIPSFSRKMFRTADIYSILTLCYCDALGYAKRQKRKTPEQLFSDVLARYVSVLTNFHTFKKEVDLPLGNVEIKQGDARKLNFPDNFFEGIITSPPYSFAIDYIKEDEAQLKYLGFDVRVLKNQMIGLRGRRKQDKIDIYFQDMNEVMHEISRVLKYNRSAIIIVGSNTRQTGGIRIEDRLIQMAAKTDLELVKKMKRPISGIRNSLRHEYILFFKKVESSLTNKDPASLNITHFL